MESLHGTIVILLIIKLDCQIERIAYKHIFYKSGKCFQTAGNVKYYRLFTLVLFQKYHLLPSNRRFTIPQGLIEE